MGYAAQGKLGKWGNSLSTLKLTEAAFITIEAKVKRLPNIWQKNVKTYVMRYT